MVKSVHPFSIRTMIHSPAHRFLRSVAPRKAFLGTAWRKFSLRSLGGQTEKERVPVRRVMVIRREVAGLMSDPTPESGWALVALSTVAE